MFRSGRTPPRSNILAVVPEIDVIEPAITRPEKARAWAYVWLEVERELADHWGSTRGALDPSTAQLVSIRYLLDPATVRPKRGEDVRDAVRRAVASVHTVKWSTVPVLPEPTAVHEALAAGWLRDRLVSRWPRSMATQRFIAHDIETLHTACRTLDLATVAAARRRPTDGFPGLPLLFLGPTGVGKELLAQAFHEVSAPGKPFEAVNCSALSGQLLESELWGHAKGAFTDAKAEKEGIAAKAATGTLFLDEVGEMSLDVQPRLLRFLNNGWYRPVGGVEQKRAFPRVLSATLSNLPARAGGGDFRSDLLQRLRGYELRVSSLAERRTSILPTFIELLGERIPGAALSVTAAMTVSLYDWPGNLREMRQAVDRIEERVGSTPGHRVGADDLPEWIQDAVGRSVPHEQRAFWHLADRPRAHHGQLVAREVERLVIGEQAKSEDALLREKLQVVRGLAGVLGADEAGQRLVTRATSEVNALRLARAADRLEVFGAQWAAIDPEAASVADAIVSTLRANVDRSAEGAKKAARREWSSEPARSALVEIVWEILKLVPSDDFADVGEPLGAILRSPVGDLLRALGKVLGDRTPAQIVADIRRPSAPSFDELRRDPKRLAAAFEQVTTLRAFAQKYGVSEETARRARAALPVSDRPTTGRSRRKR